MNLLTKIRKILGKIADVFIAGRNAGLFDEKNGPNIPKK